MCMRTQLKPPFIYAPSFVTLCTVYSVEQNTLCNHLSVHLNIISKIMWCMFFFNYWTAYLFWKTASQCLVRYKALLTFPVKSKMPILHTHTPCDNNITAVKVFSGRGDVLVVSCVEDRTACVFVIKHRGRSVRFKAHLFVGLFSKSTKQSNAYFHFWSLLKLHVDFCVFFVKKTFLLYYIWSSTETWEMKTISDV